MISRRDAAQNAFDEAFKQKNLLENQIVTLEDLTYQYTDENILELLNNKIVEFQGEIEELQVTIDNAQVSFNNIAEETIVVVATRKEEIAEIEK